MYEAHIAAPLLDRARSRRLWRRLKELGFKNKRFDLVINVNACSLRSGYALPTSHDLANPGSMHSCKCSYDDARKMVIAGMGALVAEGVQGNFEVEMVVSTPDDSWVVPETMSDDFFDFESVEGPLFENHLIWKSARGRLPSLDQVIEFFSNELGVSVHQIVDFGRDLISSPFELLSRVATVYQPSREAALKLHERWTNRRFRRDDPLPPSYAIAEQVLVVGKPK